MVEYDCMVIFACEKCKYTDLLEESSEKSCPRCGSRMISLGIASSDWNMMDEGQKESRINEIVKALEPDVPLYDENDFSNAEPDAKDSCEECSDITDKPTINTTKDHSVGKKIKKVEPVKKTVAVESKNPGRDNQKGYSYKTFMKRNRPHTKPAIKPGAVLVIVMIVCVLFALRSQYNAKNTGSISNVQPDTSITNPDLDVSSTKNDQKDVYEFKNCLYYDSLDDRDKEVYQIAYDLVMHKDESGYDRTLSMDSFEYGERENSFFPIIHAMLSDHPELFYLQSNGRKFGIRTVTMGSICTVTFSLGEGEPDENERIARFERATQDFMSDIDLNATDPEIEMQIHDKLINLVTYDYELLARDHDTGDLGYTAYGALVEDSMGLKNRAVCGGYAQAFQYLLQQAGIEAAYVTGYADSESGTLSEQGSHAWNIVKLDGEWYEVDSCWDDIDPPPDAPDKDFYKIIQYEQPQYYNATHHWYNRTTDEMRLLPEENTVITVQQGNVIHEFRPCAKSTHQRKKEKTDEGYDIFAYLNGFLPQATGTKYAL